MRVIEEKFRRRKQRFRTRSIGVGFVNQNNTTRKQIKIIQAKVREEENKDQSSREGRRKSKSKSLASRYNKDKAARGKKVGHL
jgi:hypothetical protein